MRVTRTRVFQAILAASMMSGIGCQTYEVGQAMPSPWHMRDDVQYFPKGPRFPLQNEMIAMQQSETEHAAAAARP